MKPRFEVGDEVYEKLPRGVAKAGSILAIYQFSGDYRCVVAFEDGSESVFFDFELEPSA
jgi:hypothetical protein